MLKISKANNSTNSMRSYILKTDLERMLNNNSEELNSIIKTLEKRGYVHSASKTMCNVGGENIKYEVCEITMTGELYVTESEPTMASVSYSNISGSNIAHESSDVTQTNAVTMSEQPVDIQQKHRESQEAAKNKDGSAMKKAFGYIADKAIDVAAAIAANAVILR